MIVDGHAYAYRAFHAIRSLRSPTGEPTNAIFGFIKMLAKLRSKVWSLESEAAEPGAADFRLKTFDSRRRTLVVWDGGLSAERLAALPEYKAQRPAMPADLAVQIDELVAYLGAAGVTSFCGDGVEADDYIACVARRAARAGLNVVIASSDKDFMQLVSPKSGVSSLKSEARMREDDRETLDSRLQTPDTGLAAGRIGLLNPHDKTETVWTAEQVRAKTGVDPVQIVDWLALIGDHVDNIPGVPGVGPKTAAELLNQFGSVAELYGHLDAVKSDRVRAALESSAEAVKRNVALVRLPDDLPCEVEMDELAEKPANTDALCELFRRWGFRSMLAELEASRPAYTLFRRGRVGALSEGGQEVLL